MIKSETLHWNLSKTIAKGESVRSGALTEKKGQAWSNLLFECN